jgi:hypothetical protein
VPGRTCLNKWKAGMPFDQRVLSPVKRFFIFALLAFVP